MAEAAQTTEERIKLQQADVDKLKADYEEKSSAELKLQLNRETDRLRHMVNSLKGNPKERAQASAKKARIATLNRAVQQIESE